MTPQTKRLLYKAAGLFFCVVPAAVVALHYFPLWVGERETAFSAFSLIVLALCAIPFRRVLSQMLKSPSAWQMWLILWLVLTLVDSISGGMRAVACVAFPASLVGAVFFRLAKRVGDTPKDEEKREGAQDDRE